MHFFTRQEYSLINWFNSYLKNLFNSLGCTHFSYVFGKSSCSLYYDQVTQADIKKQYPTRKYGCGLTSSNNVTSIIAFIWDFFIEENEWK